MQNYKDKIKWFNFTGGFKENSLSPLVLPNAQYISMEQTLYFYIKWSNKCKTLILSDEIKISENWCNYVIKHSYVLILFDKRIINWNINALYLLYALLLFCVCLFIVVALFVVVG